MRSSALAVGLAAAVLLASCSSEPPAPAQPAPTTTQPATSHGAYASCLAEHGVPTPPAGPGAPPGVDEQTWATAQEACAGEAPGPAGQAEPN